MRSIIIIIVIVLSTAGCRQDPRNIQTVDFARELDGEDRQAGKARETLKVAVSAMLSPRETFSSYEALLNHIAYELDVSLEFHQRRTYSEINNMLESGQLDFAFICSGAYVELNQDSGTELLTVPVVNGKPLYQAYIIVNSNTGADKLTDLKGASFAYTDLLSNAGYFYALYRIIEERENPDSFFSSTIFTNAHDLSIQMVARGLVDGATVHANMFEYIKAKDPASVRNIRIIETSPWFGINPVVASFYMEGRFKEKVRDVLHNMHLDDSLSKIINSLQIDRFTTGNDSDYDIIRMMKENIRN